jgi:hypothetical protein
MRDKRMVFRWAFSFVAFFLFFACDTIPGLLNEVYDYPPEFWGEWIRIDTGDTWRFGGNWRATGNTVGSDTVVEKQSENVIKVTEAGKTDIYLFASRLPTSSFSGTVAGIDNLASSINGSRAISGLGGMQVIISNVEDRVNTVTAQTDEDGIFTANDIVAGDKYEITVENETTTVVVNTDGDDVGTITIAPDGVNFKATLERRGLSINDDMTRLWAGTSILPYYFNIVIENTGDKDCPAPFYTLVPDPGITLTNTKLSGEFTTIEPGTSQKIPVEIFCDPIDKESENKKINITIESVFDGRRWDDSVSLKFNKEYVMINIRSDSNVLPPKAVSGIIIVPGAKAYSFTAAEQSSIGSYKTRMLVPKYYGKDYLVVFSGASANEETYYSFGISSTEDGAQDAPDLSDFSDKKAGEGVFGNDTEETALSIDPYEGFKAYLLKNDIDFYKFSF